MPTLAEMAVKLGVNVERTGIIHRPATNQFEFPADTELVIGLPATIQLENGKWVVIGCTGDVLNTGARKFDPESGCACVSDVDDGTADMFCVTCSAAPPLKVHDPAQPKEEWRTLKESGFVVSGRAQGTEVVLVLLAGVLQPWAAPGRQKIVKFTGTEGPTGVLGNKNRFPYAGGWKMDLSCTYPGTGAVTDGGTMVCGAGWTVMAKPGVDDRLFVEPWPGIPHRHNGSTCFAHELSLCADCLHLLPPPLPPSAKMDGLHGAYRAEMARNGMARTSGRMRDQPAQLAAAITGMANPVARLMHNTFYTCDLRTAEELVKNTKSRRVLEFGVEPPAPGSLPAVKPEHWADQLVRRRHCVCDGDRVVPPATACG